jgi:hypothetical protein
MKRISVIGSAVALTLTSIAVSANDPAAVMLGERAPAFSLKEVRTGETHSLEDFRGKFVVLHFGASW